MSEQKFRTEEFSVRGDAVVAKIKELVHEGNIRRIIIKNEEGQTLIEIPLTIGAVGAVLLPVWAAIGAIAALAACILRDRSRRVRFSPHPSTSRRAAPPLRSGRLWYWNPPACKTVYNRLGTRALCFLQTPNSDSNCHAPPPHPLRPPHIVHCIIGHCSFAFC